MASPGTPKTMSSRLLTMKFMQRAAASTPSTSSTSSIPASNEQSNKRRKVSHSNTPQPNVDTLVNQVAIQAAIVEEEKKVESALLKRAEELGDARWILEVPDQVKSHATQTPLNIIQVGFGQIDSFDAMGNDVESAYPSHDSVPAFRRYNMEKKKTSKKPPNTSNSLSSDSSSESDFDSESDTSSSEETSGRQSFGSNPRTTSDTQPVARKNLKGKKSVEQLKAMQLAGKRRQKEVKLNNPKGRITSISAGGGPSPVSFTCNNCGQLGHKALHCKRPGNRQGR